jgi:hypothetical protein
MKKDFATKKDIATKKLTLNRETLKLLSPSDTARIQGGMMMMTVTDTVEGCDWRSVQRPCSSGCP